MVMLSLFCETTSIVIVMNFYNSVIVVCRWAILWRAVQAVSAFGFVYAAFVVFYGML